MPNYCFRTTFIATLLFDSILVHSQLLCSIEKAVWKLAQSCPSTEANMYHYKMTATYRASIHSFMKKDPKREKHDSKWPYMAPNDLKRTKNDSKSPKNYILISGGTTPGLKSQKNCSPLSSIFDVEAPFQRYLPKSEILAPKEVTKHSGKRSIGLPGIIFFFHHGKGSQRHSYSLFLHRIDGISWNYWIPMSGGWTMACARKVHACMHA